METKQYQKWDQVIRGRVSEKMECGIQTQTAVMSLFLQRMGSLPEVRRFYTPWYNFSRLQNRPQEEPGSAESETECLKMKFPARREKERL